MAFYSRSARSVSAFLLWGPIVGLLACEQVLGLQRGAAPQGPDGSAVFDAACSPAPTSTESPEGAPESPPWGDSDGATADAAEEPEAMPGTDGAPEVSQDTERGAETAVCAGDGGGEFVLCGNACVDRLADPSNCDTCGHDCLGGACAAGACQSVTLASAVAPQGLAVDATTVYWTNSIEGSVMACAITGCKNGPVALVVTEQLYPQAIAVGGGSLYYSIFNFSNPGSVKRCGTAGCGNAPAVFASNQGGPLSIAVDARNVYWTNQDGSLMTCPLGGCIGAPVALASGRTGLQSTDALAVDATNVYWSDSAGIFGCAIAGCQNHPFAVAAGQQASGVVVDDVNVYWTDTNGGAVFKCAKTGCAAPSPLATGLVLPSGVAVDASNVYWTGGGIAGTVSKCSIDGCNGSPMTIASGLTNPAFIRVDSRRLYWIDYSPMSGTVMSLAK